ncbi:MAG: FmdB family zinc ribbon protein [Thermoanaerobaculia bacterium]
MPLYEYQCQECAETHEMLQKFSDEPQTICPSCGGALRKLFSSPAIRFKGSGFYLTDYGKGTSGPAAKADAGNGGGDSASSGAESSSAKSDSPKPGGAAASSKPDSAKSDSSKAPAPSSGTRESGS